MQNTQFSARHTIAQRLKYRRMQQGIDISELAQKLNVTDAHIEKYELGEEEIPLSQLMTCSKELKVSLGWFVQGLVQ